MHLILSKRCILQCLLCLLIAHIMRILFQNMQQTVFGSVDYDPEMLECFTPTKRLSSESKFHDVSMEDLAYVMLSSSRLSRQIKIE